MPTASSDPRTLVVQAEQFDDARNVRRSRDVHADPARFTMEVVRLGASRGDEIVAHEQRKRKVCEPVTVEVSELAAAEAELGAAEAVPAGRDAPPGRHFADDRVVNALAHRPSSLPR